MTRAYSIDLRERVIAARSEGLSVRTVGEIFDVSPSFVSKLAQRWQRSGRIAKQTAANSRRARLQAPNFKPLAMIKSP